MEYKFEQIHSDLRQNEIKFEKCIDNNAQNIPDFFLKVWCDLAEEKNHKKHLDIWKNHLNNFISNKNDRDTIAKFFHSIEKEFFEEFNNTTNLMERLKMIDNPNIVLNMDLLNNIKHSTETKINLDQEGIDFLKFKFNYEDLKKICKLYDVENEEEEEKGVARSNEYSIFWLEIMVSFMDNNNISNQNILDFFEEFINVDDDKNNENILESFSDKFTKNPNITLSTVKTIMKNTTIIDYLFNENKYPDGYYNLLSNRAFDVNHLIVLNDLYYKDESDKKEIIMAILKNPNINSRALLEKIIKIVYDLETEDTLEDTLEDIFFTSENVLNQFLTIDEFYDIINKKIKSLVKEEEQEEEEQEEQEEEQEEEYIQNVLMNLCSRKKVSFKYIQDLIEELNLDEDVMITNEMIEVLAINVVDVVYFLKFCEEKDFFEEVFSSLSQNININNDSISNSLLEFINSSTSIKRGYIDLIDFCENPSLLPDTLLDIVPKNNIKYIFRNPNIFDIKMLYNIFMSIKSDIKLKDIFPNLMTNKFFRNPKHYEILKKNIITRNLGNFALGTAFEIMSKKSNLVEYKLMAEIKKYLI
jgi:hypothetical protein